MCNSRTLLFLTFFIFAACNIEGKSNNDTSDSGPQRTTQKPENNPDNSLKVKAEIVNVSDPAGLEKLEKSAKLLEKVLNSKVLKDRILNYSYNQSQKFIDNKDLNNAEVLDTIFRGSEILTPGDDNTASLKLTLYYSHSSTVGYTTPQTVLIKINTKFFSGFDLAHVAGNLAHEWMHKLGFEHSRRNNADRDHSIPYAVGYLVRDIGENMLIKK